MKTSQLLFGLCAAAFLGSGCNRPDARADAREAAQDVTQAAARATTQLGDGWLTTKIQTQLFADADVKARNIDVSTRNGTVTLRGHVDTEQERQQALQIASTTDGVRQVQDQLMVGDASQATNASDHGASAIATRIQARYFGDPQIRGRDINVAAANGVVTLSGRVESESEKQQAIAIARSTEGVRGVDARLIVQPSLPSTPVATSGTLVDSAHDDGRVTAEIQARYFVDELVKPRRIDVDVRQGVATLRGEVASESERAQALRLARTTQGVERVEDSLTVNAAMGAPSSASSTAPAAPPAAIAPNRAGPTTPNDDTALSARLRSKLPPSVSVMAKDGVVLLEGTVPTATAKQKALAAARQVEGVTQVVDRLRIAKSR